MFDTKCDDLAEQWLDEDDVSDLTKAEREARVKSLAQAIQNAIENWCDDEAEDMRQRDEAMRDAALEKQWEERTGR